MNTTESTVSAMQAALFPGNLPTTEAKAVLAAIAPHRNRMRAAQAGARVLYAGWDRYRTAARVGCLAEADAVVRAARQSGMDGVIEMIGYENPVHRYDVGDVVRVGKGTTEWTVTGKGATTGLTLENASGRTRTAHVFEVEIVRAATKSEVR